MKKLFVLFLLVALVPFSVGCSLWGNDEDTDVLLPDTIKLTATLPGTAFGGAMRGAIPASTLTLTLGDSITFTAGTPDLNSDGTYTVVFTSPSLSLAERTALQGSQTVTIKSGNDTVLTFVLSIPTTPSSDTTGAMAITVTGTAGNLSVSVATVGTSLAAATSIAGTYDVADYAFSLATNTVWVAVSSSAATATVPVTQAGAVNVATKTPVFYLNFSEAVQANAAAAAWIVKVTRVDVANGASYTLDSTVAADAGLFTVANVTGATDRVSITLKASTTANKNLVVGETYKVEFVASGLKNADGTKSLDEVAEAFYFTVTN